MKLIEIAACRVGIEATCWTFEDWAASAAVGAIETAPRAAAASPAARRTDTRRVMGAATLDTPESCVTTAKGPLRSTRFDANMCSYRDRLRPSPAFRARRRHRQPRGPAARAGRTRAGAE